MLGNVAQEEQQELIKYYIFESYSAFSRSTNLRFFARALGTLRDVRRALLEEARDILRKTFTSFEIDLESRYAAL